MDKQNIPGKYLGAAWIDIDNDNDIDEVLF